MPRKMGFATIDPAYQRQIASQGGKAAHEYGGAHEFKAGSEEAREAGRKGGAVSSRDRARMAEIGRKGGLAVAAKKAAAKAARDKTPDEDRR